jgi:hypothetical protein
LQILKKNVDPQLHILNHYFLSSLEFFKEMLLCNCISAHPQSIAEGQTKKSCGTAVADLQT